MDTHYYQSIPWVIFPIKSVVSYHKGFLSHTAAEYQHVQEIGHSKLQTAQNPIEKLTEYFKKIKEEKEE